VYPSEAQFYAAMLRKHTTQASSPDIASHADASTDSNAHSPPSPSSPEIAPECPVPHAHPRAGAKKPNPFDMQVVVPIHNAVNERTWIEILKWEDYAPRSQNVENPETCPGGLRLVSFKGDASKLTPRARWRSLLGCVTLLISFTFLSSLSLYCIFDVLKTPWPPNRYQAPFDRHDWVIERCGQRIHYVIDYYTGRANGGGPFSFHIDARPALDSWEGIRMRVTRFLGTLWRNTTTPSGTPVPPTQSVPGTTSVRGQKTS